jgi:hypothetical protein
MIRLSTALHEALSEMDTRMITGEDQTTFAPTLLHHEGGTKFYEVITFNNPDLGLHFVVQRWGPIRHVATGGSVKAYVAPSARAVLLYADKIIKSKTGRGYMAVSSTQKLHGLKRSFDSSVEFTAALSAHYTSDQLRQIDSSIGYKLTAGISGATTTKVWVDEATDVIPPPKPEIRRDDNWGSW